MTYARYWDHSERDRAAFTADDMRRFVAVELMEHGLTVPVAPSREEPAVPTLARKRWFRVSVNYHGVVFDTVESAEAFCSLRPHSCDYDYSVGDKYAYATPVETKIEPVDLAQRSDVVALKPVLSAIKSAKEQNEKAEQEFQKATESVERQTEALWFDWRELQCRKQVHTEIARTFDEYVATAGGDEEVAQRFLVKRYSAEKINEAAEWLSRDEIAVPFGHPGDVAVPVSVAAALDPVEVPF